MKNTKVVRKCVICGEESLQELHHGQVRSDRCRLCACKARRGALNPLWKGGFCNKGHYRLIWVDPASPYHAMADKDNYVAQHRLVVAESLRRCLSKAEVVHHIDGDRHNNRLENLQLISQADHKLKTKLCSRCELRKEIRLLKWQLKQQQEQILGLTGKLMGLE